MSETCQVSEDLAGLGTHLGVDWLTLNRDRIGLQLPAGNLGLLAWGHRAADRRGLRLLVDWLGERTLEVDTIGAHNLLLVGG